jgi:hypothetical protein
MRETSRPRQTHFPSASHPMMSMVNASLAHGEAPLAVTPCALRGQGVPHHLPTHGAALPAATPTSPWSPRTTWARREVQLVTAAVHKFASRTHTLRISILFIICKKVSSHLKIIIDFISIVHTEAYFVVEYKLVIAQIKTHFLFTKNANFFSLMQIENIVHTHVCSLASFCFVFFSNFCGKIRTCY